MGKITVVKGSLKNALMKYLPFCFVIMLLGMQLITWLTDVISREYENRFRVQGLTFQNGRVVWEKNGSRMFSWVLENAEYILIPLWVIFCVSAAGYLFYNRELKSPIEILTKASKKIAENDLDFHITCDRKDELGSLCAAFEDMRGKLFASDMEIWQTMEERKRLSAAFSHDLRTPLTVLAGYVELMQSCGERITPEKRGDILSKMEQQVSRLKSYTESMNAVQKLEDIKPELTDIKLSALCSQIKDTGSIICGEKRFVFSSPESEEDILCDSAIIIRVCENLSANAVRYAESEVRTDITLKDGTLSVAVSDDGKGFSEEALKKADRPFYRGDRESNQHFGLGLYICRLLCMKCGGRIELANCENGGGKVTAVFSVGKA